MIDYSTELFLLLPEIWVASMACIILIVDLYLPERYRDTVFWLTQFTLLGALLITLNMSHMAPAYAFHGSFVLDAMSVVLKTSIYLVVSGVFFYSRVSLREMQMHKGEYYVLGLFAMLGMIIMVSANSLLVLYLALELWSLSLYAMVAFNRDSPDATEAAMKYFVLGALASGMLLYGISMIYGATGAFGIPEISDAIARQLATQEPVDDIVLVFGLCFVVVGLAFKLGAVPFHMWVPDVYQGAPTPVTLFIGAAPKIAGFAMAMRLLVDALGQLQSDWQGMLIVLAVLSLAVGNIIAIVQTNLKRMLAYSTIGHIGFILIGILSGPTGYSAAMFYSIVYALMALGGFGMIILLSRAGFEAENLDDFRGLNERSPWFAFMMLIFMFSMAGIPPLVGFHAKLAVLRAAVGADLVWLAVVAVLFSVIGAFYYLRVIKLMYFDAVQGDAMVRQDFDMRLVMSLNGLAVLGLGLYPGILMMWCIAAIA
jgi:NADH-quinone oxidoreductase subunit N